MKGKMTVSSLVLTSILAAAVVASSAAAENVTQSATGSGQFEFTSDTGVTALRTFAFEAMRSSDGSVSGQAQIDNRALGQRFHIEIDCLNVIGNIAVMSGTLTRRQERASRSVTPRSSRCRTTAKAPPPLRTG
jgi:hypothetical protein